MFDHIPTYDKYRTLMLKTPTLKGEDVYALQRALDELGYDPGPSDGIHGARTDVAVREFQEDALLVVDGKAGPATQKALTLKITTSIAATTKARYDAMMGQLEHESGFRLGIYSPPRPDGSFDAGVAQRNTQHVPAIQGFDPYPSIRALGENTRKHFDLFEGLPLRRRWILAQGAWNAPAFACYLARAEGASKVTKAMTAKPSATALKTFEEYMSKVSKYLSI